MSLYVIVGAGATGSAAARLLADAGEQVRLITRRGSGPAHDRIERVAADATDTARLIELTRGAAVLFNCAMPAYDRWPSEFPPLAASLLAASERSGADYVMLGNTYGYGPVDGPASEDLPMAPTSVKGHVRAQMWHDALAAHEEGRVRVTEVRASDYLGAGAYSPFTLMVGAQVLSGGPASYPGDLDAPHSWTYTADAARTLIAAARNERSWGRAWHVPSTSQAPVRELAAHLARAAAVPSPELTHMTKAELQAIGRTDSVMAEFPEMLYLYDRPNILDASFTAELLNIAPTPLDAVLGEMAAEHGRPGA
ncbi:NAD-dependent epimerase/dehydratase family protein [Streptomyces lavendulae]|uniref:NAD-dependent epimerase/dehydratase family protein n=1 Tax=Streptomyces lavendulae TaxID=1914 RepID=UPI0024A3F02B|nr:NAD-dependent epimerase/dehydratase family protein [Streptomyces lavendulae]GLX19685.1 NAD-dependent epimerase [Streptomyces lavendulae subsp. lavendulae]GLX27180.1 NAD-dependent epimerase [Streptomyces lavendulae subsp. lavendulae]